MKRLTKSQYEAIAETIGAAYWEVVDKKITDPRNAISATVLRLCDLFEESDTEFKRNAFTLQAYSDFPGVFAQPGSRANTTRLLNRMSSEITD